MRVLKIVLFVALLVFAFFGAVGLFFPATLASWGMTAPGADAYTRVIATSTLAFALATWFAFRDPVKNAAIVIAIIAWLGLEGLLLLILSIAGDFELGATLPGVIFDWAVAVLLVIFYPRGATGT